MNRVVMLAKCLILALVCLQGWTQYLAYHYGYAPALGMPWWTVHAFSRRHGLYAPWKALLWTWEWGTPMAKVWGVTGGGAVMLVLGLLCVRKQRQQAQPPPMIGHGTTQWATGREVRRSGLL